MTTETSPPGYSDERLETLRLTYERVCNERDRLRDARGFFSRALGPAPASAGISTALVATFAQSRDAALLWTAVGFLALLVLVGIAYGGMPAYRHLHAREIRKLRDRLASSSMSAVRPAAARPGSYLPQAPIEDQLPRQEWYAAMIELERKIYGDEQTRNRFRWPLQRVDTLQKGLDSERTGLWIVQALWLIVIVLLVASVLA